MTFTSFFRFLPPAVVAVMLAVFGLLADEVIEGDTMSFDRTILLWFRIPNNPGVPIGPLWMQEAVRDVTSLGSIALLALITLSVVGQMALNRQPRGAAYLAGSVIGGAMISSVLKAVFDRPRPDLAGLSHVFSASFPSGHATLSAVVYLTIGALLGEASSRMRLKVFYLALAVFLTVVIGVSRIYLGVHYPTDVLAGWLLGSAWAIICWIGAELLHIRARDARAI